MKLKELLDRYGDYEVSDELIAQFKKPSPKTAWDLKDGDDCYYIDVFRDVKHTGKYLRPLSEAVEMGNVFLTREEAEKDVERRKVETLLLKHGGRRWFKNGKDNMFLYYNAHFKELRYDLKTSYPVQGRIYFDDFEKLDKAVKAIGEERIINALFEVK